VAMMLFAKFAHLKQSPSKKYADVYTYRYIRRYLDR
jgi:hypothetical protein